MSAATGSGVHMRGGVGGGLVKAAPAPSHQLNAVSALSRKVRVSRAFAPKQRVNLENRFVYGTKLQSSAGTERTQLWQMDGLDRSPKLRAVVKSSMSLVPEKPLGLYDPAFDKDSCGVGFVAELSGESSRKTVQF